MLRVVEVEVTKVEKVLISACQCCPHIRVDSRSKLGKRISFQCFHEKFSMVKRPCPEIPNIYEIPEFCPLKKVSNEQKRMEQGK